MEIFTVIMRSDMYMTIEKRIGCDNMKIFNGVIGIIMIIVFGYTALFCHIIDSIYMFCKRLANMSIKSFIKKMDKLY